MDGSWDAFHDEGQQLYRQGLQGELAWALEFVQAGQDVRSLQFELDNLLVLLSRAQAYPEHHIQTMEVIRALGLLPYRLGYRADWELSLWFAVTVCEQTGRHDDRAVILNHLAEILFHQGDLHGSFGIGQAISSLALQGAARLIELVSTVRAIDSLLYQYNSDEARRMFHELRESTALLEMPDELRPAAQAQVQFIEGVILRHEGHLQSAQHSLTVGIELASSAGSTSTLPILAELYRLRGLTDWSMGQYTGAVADLRAAQRLHRQNMDLFGASITSGNLGLVYWSMAELDRAEIITRSSIRIARHLGAQLQELAERINLGLVYMSKGWIGRALPLFRAGMKKARIAGVKSEFNRARGNRGIALYHMGHYEEARRDLLTDAELSQKPLSIGAVYVTLSRCFNSLNDATEARRLARATLAIADQTHSTPLRIQALWALAECDPSSPVECLEEALTLATTAKRRLDQAGCLLILASLTKDPARWRRGVRILRRCEAEAWLEGASIEHPPHIVMLT